MDVASYLSSEICIALLMVYILQKLCKTQLLNDRQAKLKYLNAAKEGKYRLLCKSQDSHETEWHRQLVKLQSLQAIMGKLESDFPFYMEQLKHVSTSLYKVHMPVVDLLLPNILEAWELSLTVKNKWALDSQ